MGTSPQTTGQNSRDPSIASNGAVSWTIVLHGPQLRGVGTTALTATTGVKPPRRLLPRKQDVVRTESKCLRTGVFLPFRVTPPLSSRPSLRTVASASYSNSRLASLLTRTVLLLGVLTVVRPLGLDSRAQVTDPPPQYTATFFAAGSSGSSLPFWLSSNQYGTIDPSSSNAGLQVGLHQPFTQRHEIDYAFGAEMVGRASRHATAHVHELYGRLQYRGLQLTAGRREQMFGRVDTSLSLGSVTWSQNAPPLPKVSLSTDGYISVPGTDDALALNGYFAHGWHESDRFVEDVLLHEKYLYARFLPPSSPVTAHAGLVHHAQWGGTHPHRGEEPDSFGQWLDTLVGERESDEASANHIASYDFGLDVDFGSVQGRLYREFYIEDIAGLWFRNVWDGLWGVSLRRSEGPALVEAVLWEHLRMTRHNARFSAGEERGRDRYYDHSVYRGGWTYQGRTLGIPLLTPAATTPGLPNNLPGMGNNIVVAHHLGVEGSLGTELSYKLLGTYSRNYGAKRVCANPECTSTFDTNERTEDRRDQYSVQLDVRGPLVAQYNLWFRTALAFDVGAFREDQMGLSIDLTWRGWGQQ